MAIPIPSQAGLAASAGTNYSPPTQKAAFEFYGELLGWQKAEPMTTPIESYQLFAAGEWTMGGMFNKIASAPVPVLALLF